MNLDLSYYSSAGKRDTNEDALSVMLWRGNLLLTLADGLGGHADGELASRMACDGVSGALFGTEPDRIRLTGAIQSAGKTIFDRAGENEMYSTIAVLWLGRDRALSAHVGDTRIYHFRKGTLISQSRDHSVAQTAVLLGELKPEQLRTSRDRNKLFRVLGSQVPPRVDGGAHDLQPGDRFLLCTDGFWEAVTEDRMLDALSCTKTAEQWLAQMRRLPECSGNAGADNHSAIALIVR